MDCCPDFWIMTQKLDFQLYDKLYSSKHSTTDAVEPMKMIYFGYFFTF